MKTNVDAFYKPFIYTVHVWEHLLSCSLLTQQWVNLKVVAVVDHFYDLYSAILCSWANSLHSHVILHELLALSSVFLNIHWSGVLTELMWLVPHETAAVLACSVYTIQLCTIPCHFMQSHIYIHNVHMCLAVTCHLHVWQNDQDLLPSTAVTRGGNEHWHKSRHRKFLAEACQQTSLLSVPIFFLSNCD